MKLLVVFASALMLVAHGNDTPSDKEVHFYGTTKPEGIVGHVIGQEADREVPEGIFNSDEEHRVDIPQEPPKEDEVDEPENVASSAHGIYMSTNEKACISAVFFDGESNAVFYSFMSSIYLYIYNSKS